MERKTVLYLALAVTILIWGNSFVLVKLAVDNGASPVMIAMARFIVASTVFGGYILWKRPKWPDKSDIKTFLFLAFIGIGVYYIFQYYGVKFAGPARRWIAILHLQVIGKDPMLERARGFKSPSPRSLFFGAFVRSQMKQRGASDCFFGRGSLLRTC